MNVSEGRGCVEVCTRLAVSCRLVGGGPRKPHYDCRNPCYGVSQFSQYGTKSRIFSFVVTILCEEMILSVKPDQRGYDVNPLFLVECHRVY
jgi:hypothetical protein